MLAIVLLSASLAGPASAGYWDVQYDLAPGSFLETMDPTGSNHIDLLTGTLTVRYDAATQSAPLSSAKLVAGHTNVQIYQPRIFFLWTGSTDMNLIPTVGGTPGTLSGASLTFGVVVDSSTTGFRHCNENVTAPGQTANCLLAGMTHSVPSPQTPTGPGPFPQSFPKFVFAATAGVGGFTSTVGTQTLWSCTGIVTLHITYVGREVSRVWYGPTPLPSISFGGLALLAGLVLGIVGWARRVS
jgi:hypothetical protein